MDIEEAIPEKVRRLSPRHEEVLRFAAGLQRRLTYPSRGAFLTSELVPGFRVQIADLVENL